MEKSLFLCVCGAFKSTRKQPETKAASELVSTARKNKGHNSKEPVIYLDKLAPSKTPEVNFTFRSPSSPKRMTKQKEPVVSAQCSASKKEEAKVASQQPAIQSRMRKGPKQREYKEKAPSEESAALPRGAEKDKQI